ncbi:Cof-type HAD-IIB family hydrolase [Ligilactobacillus equi]|uniref:Cof-type HAD-IIB family hydrolase n=1 Tax=Ligilactobacillus equi TaxID=137357 RepID=UPI000AE18C3E|nr:Cof-type HAD-IIB family hydrolase [Ligilactobacillus equi]MCQ2556730.1 Cof-type HAD-IIB family hydrolase [Ligilactobacillus sp.]
MIKLIATDIDGTLVNDDKKLSAKTIATIKKARQAGIYVVLCTGRPLSGVAEYLEELGLTSDDDYVITFNGAAAQKVASQEVLFKHTLEFDEFQELLDFSLANQIKHQIITPDNQIYTCDFDVSSYTVLDAFYTHMPLHVRTKAGLPQDLTCAKFMWADQKENLDRGEKILPAKLKNGLYTVRSEDWFFEFQNAKATKGQAVYQLAEHLGIKPEEVMTVGDQQNDLSMLTPDFFGVAMGNGNDLVKAAAKVTTASNNDDGLAQAIEKYVLN